MPIVQTQPANDALLGIHCITRITKPHFHCFSGPRFGPRQAPGSPSQMVPFRLLPPPHPLNSLRSVYKLKPSLSAGFRNIYSIICEFDLSTTNREPSIGKTNARRWLKAEQTGDRGRTKEKVRGKGGGPLCVWQGRIL